MLVFAFSSSLTDTQTQSRNSLDQASIDRMAENAISLGIHKLWQPFQLARTDEDVTTHYEVRGYLEGLGITDQSDADTPVRTDLIELFDLDVLNARSSGGAIRSANIEALTVHRVDDGRNTTLTFQVTASSRRGEMLEGPTGIPTRATFEAVYEIVPQNWNGLDYALLANNVNCAMCHMNVDDANRFWNRDASQFGSFNRVKVASLESFHLRDRAFSRIHGTLYLGAKGYDENGEEITNWPDETIDSVEMDSFGNIVQDQWGGLRTEDLSPASETGQGNFLPFENLYLEYLNPAVGSVDGYLPTAFPAIFPDNGGIDPVTGDPVNNGQGNRVIDEAEFYAATLYSNGTITGGHRHVVPNGQTVNSTLELDAMRSVSNVQTLEGRISGSTYLRGTPDDPIVLDGEVAFDGDLILHGFVKGSGALKVSGNVYIPDSLIYLDGADENGHRSFGVAADGTTNALAIGAGGNVLVGDVFRPRWGTGFTTGDDEGSFSFVLENLAAFNRREWTKTQDVLPGPGEDLDRPETWTVNNPLYEGANYVPRYYSFDEGDPIPISRGGHFDAAQRSWVDTDLADDWDGVWQASATDLNDPLIGGRMHGQRPVITTITGTEGWIDNDQLRALITDQLSAQPDNRYVVVDGTIYSNNSIFGIIGARNADGTLGKLAIEGAVVAADVGLLAPVDLRIHYDSRGKALLDILSTGQMTIRNVLWHRVADAEL